MKKWILILLVVLVAGSGSLVYVNRAKWLAPKQVERRAVFTVKPQDLLISITEGGTLEAVNEVTIVNEVQGQSQIITLAPEGSYVKKGDLLVELDSSELEERFVQQQISYQNALSAYTKAAEDRDIQRSRNESDTREAELAVDFAKIDLEKYRDGDWPQAKKVAESAITIAEAELKRAQDRLTWTEKLQKKGYATRAELDADTLDVKRKQLELDQKQEKMRLMEKYEYPQQIRKLESEELKKNEEMARVKARASSAIAQAIAEVASRKATLELQQDKLSNIEEQLQKTKIFAPQAGLVVYASSVGRRSSTQIVEGALVRQRQDLIKLPDISQMKVQVKVHESRMNQLNVGQKAFVVIDALPDRRFSGRVSKVSILPDSQSSWLNPDLKVYSTDIIIDEALPADVKPGLSARGEIIVDKLQNVLTVPIQAVTAQGDSQLVYRVIGPDVEPVKVEVGMFNDAYIQIVSGLNAGDVVLLNPPVVDDAMNLRRGLIRDDEVTQEDTRQTVVDETAVNSDKETVAVAASVDLAKVLSKLPEDKRADLRERWPKMSETERKIFVKRLRSRGESAEVGP